MNQRVSLLPVGSVSFLMRTYSVQLAESPYLCFDSQKHKTSKSKLLKEAKQRNIAELLKKYDKEHHPKGETLPNNVRVYRVTVVKSFLKAGIPLSKVDCMRDLLEEHAFSLSGRQHLSETIPFIHQQEIDEIKQEISGKKVSVIFDGTTHVDEALAVLLRFCGQLPSKAKASTHIYSLYLLWH